MENSHPHSEQLIRDFTVTELESLITTIVKQVLKQERENLTHSTDLQRETPPEAFVNTAGSWKDDRSPEEIIEDIYASR